MKLVALSDTHGLHRDLSVPSGDLLIHCGDFSERRRSERDICDFAAWLQMLPHPHKLLVPGNHDFWLEANLSRRSIFRDAHLLLGTGVTIDGLRIWGSPVTPLYGGAFGMSNPSDRRRHWDGIPLDIDLLVTHGPPAGVLDSDPGMSHSAGDPQLLKAVSRIKPRYHIFGHVHEAFGLANIGPTTFLNVALIDHGKVIHNPVEIELCL